MGETVDINGILYLMLSKDDLLNQFGITIDAEYGLMYAGPVSGTHTDEVIEVPESITYDGITLPVVGFAGGMIVLQTQNAAAAASVSEVILPSSISFLIYGFYGFTNLQKITCYAEFAPKLSSEIGGPAGIDFEGTPGTKELHIPSDSDYSTWEDATTTTWASVNEIYDGFVEIVGGLKYKETSETTVALIGYDETFNSTSITIPSSITHEGNSYTVTEIKNAFKNYTGLTEVNIPDSVTKISETAFSNTQGRNIDTVIDNLNITVIDNYTCEINGLVTLLNVKDITFNYNNTSYNCNFGNTGKIGGYSNEYNTNLTGELNLNNIYYEGNKVVVTYIGDEAFSYCSNLTYITIPDSVTKIGYRAFYNCTNLTTITIPDSVTSIGEQAFRECSSLQSITIPASVTSIGGFTFYGCSSLNSITIPDSVTSIGEYVFYECSSLTSIDIPNSVTYIGNNAFYECLFENSGFINNSSLDEVSNNYWGAKIYDEITDEGLVIQENIVIDARKNITSVTIPDSVTSIGEQAFMNCDSLTSIIIPDSVTSIGNRAFYSCDSLTSITIPDSVTSIGNRAFQYCTKLNTLNFNAINCNDFYGGTTDHSFYNTSISVINIGDSVQRIPAYFAYSFTKLTSVTIPNSVTSIGERAFYGCSSLTSVTIGNSVTEIGEYVFYSCGLTSVSIPDSVTSIGKGIFYNCSSLTSVIIGNSVTYIGDFAFMNCSSLISVYMLNPTAVTTPNHISELFPNTPSTKILFVPIDATGYSTSWGETTWAAVNYSMVSTEEIIYKVNDERLLETFSPNNKVETLTIPSTVTYNDNTYSVKTVSRNSLANDNKIKTLTIESGINKIEASALSGCNNLETVNIPNSVTEIDNHAFWMCKNLKTVNLPNTLTKLKPEMFVECESLETITIPEGITVIPYRMFESCDNLTTVNLPTTITKIEWSAFKDCVSLTTINIPSGCTVDSTAFEGTNTTINRY